MASAWIFLQYAECFAGGFLTSYLLCSRSPKKPVEKEEIIASDIDQTEIVVISEEEAVTKMTDVRNDHSYEKIANGKQQGQGKQNREEAKSEQEQYAEQVKGEKNTE